jgi:hypothetical protein
MLPVIAGVKEGTEFEKLEIPKLISRAQDDPLVTQQTSLLVKWSIYWEEK